MTTRHLRHGKSGNEWDEIGNLYQKLLYWLYQRTNSAKARAYAEQLDGLLSKADPNQETIWGEECRSLIHEARGNLPEAIKHRQNEISLIRQLYAVSKGQPYERAALKGYDYSDLSDRLNLLAGLFQESGRLGRAIRTLEESKQLCTQHGITFDADELLRELREQTSTLRCWRVSENGALIGEQASAADTMPSTEEALISQAARDPVTRVKQPSEPAVPFLETEAVA